MLVTITENFVLFSTAFALAGFALAWLVRACVERKLWRLRVDTIVRLYTGAIVAPPLIALWVVGAAFLPRLWLTAEAFEAAHSAPYHQLHLLGELTIALEPMLSYVLASVAIVVGTFAVWSNLAGSWRVGNLIKRLDMNALPPPTEQVETVKDLTAKRGMTVGLVMTDYPLSLVWGIRRSQLILSSGLLRTLTPEQLTGVLEHEAAHHRRRDNLLKLLLSLATYTSVVFPLSRLVLRWRATEVEVICDETAVASTSAPLELAEALIRLRRQTIAAPAATSALASGFVSGNAATFQYRIDRLLSMFDGAPAAGHRRRIANKSAAALVAASLLTLFVTSFFAPLSLHHGAEALIQILK